MIFPLFKTWIGWPLGERERWRWHTPSGWREDLKLPLADVKKGHGVDCIAGCFIYEGGLSKPGANWKGVGMRRERTDLKVGHYKTKAASCDMQGAAFWGTQGDAGDSGAA
jgi:hypothetical protein